MDGVYEDIGYSKGREMEERTVYKIEKVDKIKIEYLWGMMKGRVVKVRADIAEDLIKHGKAVDVK